MKRWLAAMGVALLAAPAMLAQPTYGRPALLRHVGIDQKPGAQLPLDAVFTDDAGHPVTLRSYAGKPMVLALVYYACPSLCDMVLNGVLQSVRNLKFTAGKEFEIVAISFDPRENAELARDKKANYAKEYRRADGESGLHFLTGPEASSRAVAQAAGFRYAFDANTNQYVHPAAILVVTPEGRISRYFYGVNYPVRDLKLGLMDAAGGRIGTAVDQVQLFCFHYDLASGRYGLVIRNVLRLGGLLTLVLLSGGVLLMLWRDRQRARWTHG